MLNDAKSEAETIYKCEMENTTNKQNKTKTVKTESNKTPEMKTKPFKIYKREGGLVVDLFKW